MEITSPATEGLIKDSNTANFAADVVDASRDVPVIVDFWAPWCGPCKQLGPMLESIVTSAGGAVKLVKINVDENQELAGQLRVQSIPMVYAFKDGQPVDAFTGALPESQIKEFIGKLAGPLGPSPGEELIEAGLGAMAAGDLVAAEGAFRQAAEMEPGNLDAISGVIQCRVKAGDADSARQILEAVPEADRDSPALSAAAAALAIAEMGSEAGDLGSLRATVEADGADLQARFDYATALVAAGNHAEGIEHLLEIVRRDREWSEEGARKQLVTVFEALGASDPLTVTSRRALSSILFS